MASITIKNIPDELLERVRTQAAADKRSMTKEIIYLLEIALAGSPEANKSRLQREAAMQVEAWTRLAGRWQSDLTRDEEIESLYAHRSGGRDVDL